MGFAERLPYFIVTRGHGGKMWVESAPGAGARFVMELPVSAAPDEKEPDVAPD